MPFRSKGRGLSKMPVKKSHNALGQQLCRRVCGGGKLLGLILFYAVTVYGVGAGLVQAQGTGNPAPLPGLGQLSVAEKWVLEKVSVGEVADLKEKFGADEAPRQLRACSITIFTRSAAGF